MKTNRKASLILIITINLVLQFTTAGAQKLPVRKMIFDDFEYSSVELPAEGDSSGSIFGRNPWLTPEGTIYSRCWYRYNRDEHSFSDKAEISLKDFGFTMEILKGFKPGGRGPLIHSGFYCHEGTFAARVKFHELDYASKSIQAFWLNSTNYFRFFRGSEEIRYWSEMDFEFNNYFAAEDINTVQIGCNNRNGKSPVTTRIDCLCKTGGIFKYLKSCLGTVDGRQILSGQWYVLKFNLDSAARTVSFSMYCDSVDGQDKQVWAGDMSGAWDWGKPFVIEEYFPNYPLLSIFSLHMADEGVAGNDNRMDVDWYYYSEDNALGFNEIDDDVSLLKNEGIARASTCNMALFNESISNEPKIISIEGPDTVFACNTYKWSLNTNNKLFALFEMDFKYRIQYDSTYSDWLPIYSPELTLAVYDDYKSIEIMSKAFANWVDYFSYDTIRAIVLPGECSRKGTVIIYEPVPNPALLSSEIKYELLKTSDVNISIYDSYGRLVEALENKTKGPGIYSLAFDAAQYANDVYICIYNIGGKIYSRKIIINKG